jgi:universal stress protein A
MQATSSTVDLHFLDSIQWLAAGRGDGCCPAVRSREDAMITLKKILVPTDFSDFSQFALEFALPLAEKFQAKIYLMHVWQLPMTSSFLPAEPYPEAVLTEAQKTGADHLANVAGELKASGFDIEPVFTLGKPYVEIVKAAATLDADLIVLASHGRSGVSHLVLGSVAEKVVRLAPCPVFTVKARRPAVSQAA